jgi:branched-chain amino acid transport system permease protein
MLEQSIFNGLMSAAIYILIAMGLTLVLSILGIVQLAHGEIYMLGAYGAYFFCTMAGLHFLPALLASMVATGVLGIGLEKIFFRPFRSDPERAVIVAIGLILFLQQAVFMAVGGVSKSLPNSFSGVIRAGGIVIPIERLIIVLAAIVLIVFLLLLINKTKMGQAMVAVSQDRDSASLYGIDIDRTSAFAMFLGCFLAAAAGGLVGSITGISPGMGGVALIKGIAVIILGGLGSITGAVIGGFIIGMIDGIVPIFFSTQVSSVTGFLIIIVILILRPRGLMGHE